jgi:hypothetical protein
MESAGFASDLAGLSSFFIDPEGAAKRVHSKWFWIVPLLVCSIIAIGVGIYMAPMIVHVAAVSPIPDGVTAEAHEKQVAITGTFAKVGAFFSPIFIGIFWAIFAGILMGVSVVAGVTGRFGEYFNLIAGCGLIQSLQSIATAVILHFKGDVSTAAELRPAMGLDIFLPEGTNKYLVAAGGSFSVFQIWWLVMFALIYAAAFRVSKGKAFAIAIPLWLVGMLFGMLGAVFQK